MLQAQRFRRWYRERVLEIFAEVDVILAPATPCVAPPIGQKTMVIAGLCIGPAALTPFTWASTIAPLSAGSL